MSESYFSVVNTLKDFRILGEYINEFLSYGGSNNYLLYVTKLT